MAGRYHRDDGLLTPDQLEHLEALLRQNIPPSLVDLALLHDLQTTRSYHQERSRRNADQQQTDTSENPGLCEDSEAKMQAQRYSSLNAPIRALPPEILLLIFQFAAPSNRIDLRRAVTCQPALVISHVCCYWRTLSTSCSTLWSNISLHIYGGDKDACKAQLTSLVRLYLDRSANRELTLTTGRYFEHTERDVLHPAVAALLEDAHRWVSLTIGWTLPTIADNIAFPALKHLDFENCFFEREFFQNSAVRLPKLRNLELIGCTKDHERHGLVPWSRLTSLTVFEPRYIFYTDCLTQCCRLNNLVLVTRGESGFDDTWSSDEPEVPPSEPIHISIRSLTLQYTTSDGGAFLDMFTLPSLKDVVFEAYHEHGKTFIPFSIRSFTSFVTRSNLTNVLTMFSIEELFVSSHDLIAALHLLPALRGLCLFSVEGSGFEEGSDGELVTEDLIQLMGSGGASVVLLPSLEMLWLKTKRRATAGVQDLTFIQMLTVRSQSRNTIAVSGLRHVHFMKAHDRFDPMLLPSLKSLKSGGLDLVVYDKKGDVFTI